jgi:hypothetical protein
MVPPPLYMDNIFGRMNTTLINKVVHDLVPQIAEANGLDWISIYHLLGGVELLQSGLLPNRFEIGTELAHKHKRHYKVSHDLETIHQSV